MTQARTGSAEDESPDVVEGADPARWRVLTVLLGAIFMSLIGVSIVNVTLPSIQIGLGASQSDLQWVLSGYALTFGVVLVAAGRAGDLLGRGGIFIIGVAIFTLSSIASSAAPSAEWLNISRFIQGVGSGLLNPQGVGMIQQYFRGKERGRAFGYFGSMVGVSVAIGPVLGGLLIYAGGPSFGWRLTFLVNVPVGLITMFLAWKWFPRPLIRSRAEREAASADGAKTSMDPIGSIILGLAVLAFLFPFVESRSSAITWVLLPIGIALTVGWVVWEKRYAKSGRSPMVDLNIFKTRSFSNGTIIVTLYFLGMTSVWVIVAMYMQQGAGKSAFEAGLVGIPSAALSAYAADWAGKRVMNLGRRIVIGGMFFALAGLGLSIAVVLLHEAGYISIWWLLASLALVGIAQGSVISPNQTLTLAEVPLQYAGSSGAVMQTGQRIGTSVGIAVVTAAMFATLAAASWGVAFTVAFALIGLVVIVALVFAFKDQLDRKKGVVAS